MGKRSRTKGAAGEREAAGELTRLTGRPWRRSVGQCRSGADAPDIERDDGPTEVHVEVKRGRKPNWRAAMAQADEATDGRPVWILTRDDRGEWMLHVRVRDLWSLAHAALEAWVVKRDEVVRREAEVAE